MIRLLLNISAYILVLVINTLAVTLPLNGQSTGEISNRLDVFFTPAGYVFSIWSLIYLLLGIWVIRQLTKKNRHSNYYRIISPYFIVTCLLNSAWIFMWHYNYFAISVAVMIGLLITLILTYNKARKLGRGFFDKLPFSVYLGWISVATIANISYYLTYIEWDGLGTGRSVILLILALSLAVYFRIKQQDWVYPLVFIWAIIGIGINNQGEHPILSALSFSVAGVILLTVIFYSQVKHN